MKPRAAFLTTVVFCLTFIAVAGVAVVSGARFWAVNSARSGHPDGSGITRALRVWPSHWRYLLDRADVARATGAYDSALSYYRRATSVFPACGECWIGAAETLYALGEDPRGELAAATRYGGSQTAVRTRAAVVYAKLGERQIAVNEFSAALGGHSENRDEFYEVLHRVFSDDLIRERIITERELPSYVSFAFRGSLRFRPAAVSKLWEFYRETSGDSEGLRPAYVSYLLGQQGLVHKAWRMASQDKSASLGAVVDGDFEGGLTVGSFGWSIGETEGVDARVVRCDDCDSGARALRLRFDGEHNVQYADTTQVVAVVPGADYRLTFRVKHEEITSRRGPALVVRGVSGRSRPDCGFRVESEEFRLSSPWRDVDMNFSVPGNCEGVRIYIFRPRTERLNRLIGGEFWIDDVSLERAGPLASKQASNKIT